MNYPYWANIVVTDLDLGNFFASKIDPDSGGSKTFGNQKLRKDGEEMATAWAASTPLSQGGLLAFNEFSGDGPYNILTALGITEEKIAEAKASFHVQYGDRSIHADGLGALIDSLGYNRIPVLPEDIV